MKNNREGGFNTSRGYRQSKAQDLSARDLRDGSPFWSMFGRFTLIIMVSMAYGRCGTLFNAKVSMLVARRLPRLMRLAEHGITASTRTVGDSYDNALAENVNGSHNIELI